MGKNRLPLKMGKDKLRARMSKQGQGQAGTMMGWDKLELDANLSG